MEYLTPVLVWALTSRPVHPPERPRHNSWLTNPMSHGPVVGSPSALTPRSVTHRRVGRWPEIACRDSSGAPPRPVRAAGERCAATAHQSRPSPGAIVHQRLTASAYAAPHIQWPP